MLALPKHFEFVKLQRELVNVPFVVLNDAFDVFRPRRKNVVPFLPVFLPLRIVRYVDFCVERCSPAACSGAPVVGTMSAEHMRLIEACPVDGVPRGGHIEAGLSIARGQVRDAPLAIGNGCQAATHSLSVGDRRIEAFDSVATGDPCRKDKLRILLGERTLHRIEISVSLATCKNRQADEHEKDSTACGESYLHGKTFLLAWL